MLLEVTSTYRHGRSDSLRGELSGLLATAATFAQFNTAAREESGKFECAFYSGNNNNLLLNWIKFVGKLRKLSG